MKLFLVVATALSLLAVASPITNSYTTHPSDSRTMKLRQIRRSKSLRALESRQTGIGEILDPLKNGQSFVAQVSIGSESFDLTLDTGSADLWVVGSNVTCTNPVCNWGATYDEQSGNFQSNGGTFSVTYGGSNTDSGYTGTADVSLAGLTITAQPIGVADKVVCPFHAQLQ